jgi:hypothetical protein
VYPQVINCGESIHFVGPPLAIDMSTAIAIVFTDYGFGIAADSRHCEEGNDTPLSDSVEKIFELDCVAGCSAAYMLCGIMEIVLKPASGPREVLFDFRSQIPDAIAIASASEVLSLRHFANAIGEHILEKLRPSIESRLPPDAPGSKTNIVIVGYYNSHPECVAVEIIVPPASDQPYHETIEALKRDVPIGCCPRPILDKLQIDDGDPRFANYRPSKSFGKTDISRAVEIAHNAVRAHYDPDVKELAPDACKAIGGIIRLAKITPADGFSWVRES